MMNGIADNVTADLSNLPNGLPQSPVQTITSHQQFYEALRFRSIPLRDFYGDGGIDAVMYVRDLESQA